MKKPDKLQKQCGLCQYYQACQATWGLCTLNPPQSVSLAGTDGEQGFRWFSPTVPLNRKACRFFEEDRELKMDECHK